MSYNNYHSLINEINKTLFNTSAIKYFSPIIESLFPNYSFDSIKAEITDIIRERNDVVSLVLVPGKKFQSFIPGQYVEVTIKINAVRYSRIFSISSSLMQLHKDNTIVLTIQKQKNGKVTSWIHENSKIGDIIEISRPAGEFVLPIESKKVVFIAGGSGITPFRSMIYQTIERNIPVTLLYYCNTTDDLIFRDELISLRNKNTNIILIDSASQGYIHANHLKYNIEDKENSLFYVCGPEPMLNSAQKILSEIDIKDEHIIIERFRPIQSIPQDIGHLEGWVTISKANNLKVHVDADSSILQSLELNGVFPNHGCRMGICKKCQCTKKSGIVYNKVSQRFSESYEEKIEICSSIPVGNVEIEL